jgi:uncharacterized protein (DUF58 family)
MDPLIDEAFLRQLSNLRVIVKGRQKGYLAGVHTSPRAGMSLEFADYRDYVPGDDFRYVDWNIYGRLDRVLVKTFVHEVDVPIYILLDLSASMSLGKPPKARYAARLAAALTYLGLRELDRVGLYPFTDHLLPAVTPRHGMGHMARILKALQATPPKGKTSLDLTLNEFVTHSRESGLVFLISDLLCKGGYEEGISRLLHRGDEIVVIQVVDSGELEPSIEGSLRITDTETLDYVDLIVGRGTLTQYKRQLTTYLETLRNFLVNHRIPYFLAPTDFPIERLIHERLRAGGVLR